jgi:hypothetical protein
MVDEALVESFRERLNGGEQIDYGALTPNEQAAVDVLLAETRALMAE